MFGRDSTGGALRIWTKKPGEEFAGNMSATVGTLDRRDVKAAFDLPLTDKLLTRWTAASLSRDGYIHSLTTDQNNGGIDQTVFRGDIVWRPTDKLDFRFNYQNNGSEFTEPRVQDAIYPTYRQFLLTAGVAEFYGLAGAAPFDRVEQLAGYPGGRVGKWENRSDTTVPNNYLTEQSTVEVNWQLTDSMRLQFLTSNIQQDADTYVDWDSSQYALVNDLIRSKLDMFSEEIQLTGGGERVSWVAGLYYWDQDKLLGARATTLKNLDWVA